MASLSETVREWLLAPLTARLTNLEASMADTSALLTEVANGLRGPLYTSVQALIASEAAARAEAAELRGEDVAESAAAQDVRAAFSEVAGLFAAEPTVPDVPELPAEGEAPADVTG